MPPAICAGGTKLSTKAMSEPSNPTPPKIHIPALPNGTLYGRGVFGWEKRRKIAAENIMTYMIRYSVTVNWLRIW